MKYGDYRCDLVHQIDFQEQTSQTVYNFDIPMLLFNEQTVFPAEHGWIMGRRVPRCTGVDLRSLPADHPMKKSSDFADL